MKKIVFILFVLLLLSINLYSKDKVIAKFNGGVVTTQDVDILYEGIPAPFRKLIQRKANLKKRAILLKLISLEYKNKKLDDLTKRKIELCKNKILLQKYYDDKLKNITVTDSEIKKYYEAHKDEFSQQSSFKFNLLSFNSLKEANKIYEKIKKGEKFEKFSNRPSNNRYIPEKYLPLEFRNELKNLKNGEVSKPIKFNNKYFLVKLLDKKIIPGKTFNQVKDSIKNQLYMQKKNKLREKLENDLFKKYNVKILQ